MRNRHPVAEKTTLAEIDDHDNALNENDDASSNGSHGGDNRAVKKIQRRSKSASHRITTFKYAGHLREEHGQALFGVQFNPHVDDRDIFATCGSNKVSVYEVLPSSIKLLQSYADPEPDEMYYTVAWGVEDSGEPILAVAGARGIVRIINLARTECVQNYVGHGHSINEVKFHPRDPSLLLSVSKDHTLRLWNLRTEQCVAIFGGVEGHRDEVLSADFDLLGQRIISCGMDHSLKLWQLNTPVLQRAIHDSHLYLPSIKHSRAFPTANQHYPDFTTRDIHQNYVDCVRWLGNFILSKSCEQVIVCWKPGYMKDRKQTNHSEEGLTDTSRHTGVIGSGPVESAVTIVHQFHYRDSQFWFLRFGLSRDQRQLAVGNQLGKTFVWDIDVVDPASSRCMTLSHPKCTAIVRQTSFTNRGDVLICVCDDATIWRWDRPLQHTAASSVSDE